MPVPPDSFLGLITGFLTKNGFETESDTTVETNNKGTYIKKTPGPKGERIRWGIQAQDGDVHAQIFEVLNHENRLLARVTRVPKATVWEFKREVPGSDQEEKTDDMDIACAWVDEILQGLKSPESAPSVTPP